MAFFRETLAGMHIIVSMHACASQSCSHSGMGRKKPLSTAELLARSQDKKKPSKEEPDSWENDAAAIAAEEAAQPTAEQQAAPLALPPKPSGIAERVAAQKKRDEAAAAAKREAAKVQSEQAAVVAEAMARKKGKAKGKGKAAAATAAAPSVQPSVRRAPDAAPPAAQQHRRAPPEAPPLLSEVAPARRNVHVPEECAEEWEAASGGGFVRMRYGYHPGVSCDATGQNPLIGRRHQLLAEHCDAAAHPHGYDVCDSAFAALDAAERERFELIEPPCRAPLAYVIGSKEHLTLVSLGLVVIS